MKRKSFYSIALCTAVLLMASCGNGTDGIETAATENVTSVGTTAADTETESSVSSSDETEEETSSSETETSLSETVTSSNETEKKSTENSPVSYYGALMTDGNRIIGSKTNDTVQVTGMSFFWSNWSQKYYTSEYVDLMADEFGCEILRCSYGIQDDGIPYDETCEPLIEDVINEAINKGLYVIIDWHSHGAHRSPEEAAEYFGQLAEKFGSYDNVIFEIYNEPRDVGWKDIKTYAETVIPAIREYSDNLIVVGTPNWSQDVDIAAGDPLDGENIAYALHFYAGTHKGWLRSKADKAIKAGIPLFITEWGGVNADGNGSIDVNSTKEWFEWIDENKLSSCNWAINDKDEGSSIFVSDSDISETGKFIKELINERTSDAPWRE